MPPDLPRACGPMDRVEIVIVAEIGDVECSPGCMPSHPKSTATAAKYCVSRDRDALDWWLAQTKHDSLMSGMPQASNRANVWTTG